MITLYSGTPGSGKSLDTARTIYNWCRRGVPIICNFPVAVDKIKVHGRKDIHYVPNDQLTPDFLLQFSRDHFADRRCKEDSILLVIDESQLLFNARDWGKKDRAAWNWFFTMHRHFGYYIILCAQFDRMLDRQIRALIEYEFIHRKVCNLGLKGLIVSTLMLSPTKTFCKVKVWYPMREKVGSEFFRCRKKYYRIYDTFELLDDPERAERGGNGGPSEGLPGSSISGSRT